MLGCERDLIILRCLPICKKCVLAWAVWLPQEIIVLDIYLLRLHFHLKEGSLGV